MKRFTIIIVLLLSLFGIADLFKSGYYSSHDGIGHVIRMEEFYQAFNDGQIPVRWSKRLYFGYGYPFFNFNYPSIYYLGIPLMKVGLSATDTMKAETMLAFVASGGLMFLYLQRKVRWQVAVLGAVLYLYAPYRMSNIYVRGSVAEAMAFIFPPLLLWGAESLGNIRSILWLSLVIGFMGISHNISALLLSAFYFGYLGFLSLLQKSLWPVIKGSLAFALGILMAAFFLVPALYEKKWTFLDLTIAKDYPNYFVNLWQLVDPRWSFGVEPLNLGWVILGLFLTALIWGRRLVFFILTVVVSIFFMLPPSKIFWDHLPLLPFVQFPWRFTMLTVPALVVGGVLGTEKFLKNWVIVFLIVLTLILASVTWSRSQVEFAPVFPGDAIPGSTTWAHEQATRWLVPKPDKIPKDKIENANYNILFWKTGEHDYKIIANGKTPVVENTMYYPGWKVFVDGKETSVDYQNKDYPGRLVYFVTSGGHEIKSIFTENTLRKTVDIISLVTFVGVVLSLLFSYVVPQISSKH